MKYYHIITQSYRGKNILPEPEDCVAYLHLVAKSFQQYHVLWLGYAMMPNHIHLCAAMPSDDEENNILILRKARRKVACGYIAHARKQHPELFFKEPRIFEKYNQVKFLQTPYDVRNLIRYIHLNPLRKDLENVPGETIRCSHQAILSLWEPQDSQNPFNCFAELQRVRNSLAAEEFFRLFGRNRNEQKQNYLSLLSQPLTDEQATQLNAQAQGQAQGQAGVAANARAGGKTSTRANAQTRLEKETELRKAEQVLRAYFSQHYAFQGKEFTTESRQAFLRWLNRPKNSAHKRAVVTYIAKRTSLSSREIAEVLNVGWSTVKNILKGQKR